MAFLSVSNGGGDGEVRDRLPILKFDARAGRMFTIDRFQGADGWESSQTDITMQQPSFAVDFLSLEVGFAHFAAGAAPMWAVVPYGQPMPARPPSPGADDKGKAIQFKSAFRVKVCGQGIGGVRELGGNSGAFIGGMNDLHTAYEKAPEAAQGMIPVVKMTGTLPIKSGQSTNYSPIFEIQQWVARPAPLGAPLVSPPVPGGAAIVATPSTAPTNHVPPPVAVAAGMPF